MKNSIRNLVSLLAVLSALVSCNKPEPQRAPVKLDAPSPAIAVVGINNVTILWDEVPGADSYVIQLGEQTIPVTGVSATVGDLESSRTYTLKMKSIAPDGSRDWLDSDFSEPLEFMTKGRAPIDSPVLNVRNITADGFEIYWNAVKNASEYVYVGPDGVQQSTVQTTVTFTGLTYSTEYTVKVKAMPSDKASATSAESAWAEKKVSTAGRTELSVPVLTVSGVHTNGFVLSWTAVTGASSYKYRIDGGEEKTTGDLTVAFDGLKAATEYSVSVCAVPSAADEGKYVAGKWAETKVKTGALVVLSKPELRSENVLATEFTVCWAAVEHAAAYMVSFNGGSPVRVTSLSSRFEGLPTETEFSVSVQAVPADGQTGTYLAGEASVIKVTTKKGPSPDDKGGNLPDFDEETIF